MKSLLKVRSFAIYILLACVLLASCDKGTQTAENSKKTGEITVDIKTSTFVECSAYGRLGEGSVIYRESDAVNGYLITFKRDGMPVKKTYAHEHEIESIVDRFMYKAVGVDSVANYYNERYAR